VVARLRVQAHEQADLAGQVGLDLQPKERANSASIGNCTSGCRLDRRKNSHM
jgi:hypothetical protein